jgi:hypothetical protein
MRLKAITHRFLTPSQHAKFDRRKYLLWHGQHPQWVSMLPLALWSKCLEYVGTYIYSNVRLWTHWSVSVTKSNIEFTLLCSSNRNKKSPVRLSMASGMGDGITLVLCQKLQWLQIWEDPPLWLSGSSIGRHAAEEHYRKISV